MATAVLRRPLGASLLPAAATSRPSRFHLRRSRSPYAVLAVSSDSPKPATSSSSSSTGGDNPDDEPVLPLLQELADCLALPPKFLSQLPSDLRLDLNDAAFDLSNGPVLDECGQEVGDLLLNLAKAWEMADTSASNSLAKQLPSMEPYLTGSAKSAFGKRLMSAGRRFQSMGQYGKGELKRIAETMTKNGKLLSKRPVIQSEVQAMKEKRKLKTPNSPVAAGSSGGRKTSKRIILACQGATQNSPEISLTGMGYAPLNMLGIIQSQKTAELLLDLKVNSILCSPQVAAVDTATTICEVQEAADCLGADCVPRYVEMKKLLELEIDDSFQTKQKSFGEIVQSGWLGSMEYKTLEGLWDQSKDAWQALLNELPDDATSDGVLVAVGHPAMHLALICRCLNLTMDYMSSFHLDDGSISVIDFPDGPKGRGVIRCTNYTAHLGRWSIPITRTTETDEAF